MKRTELTTALEAVQHRQKAECPTCGQELQAEDLDGLLQAMENHRSTKHPAPEEK